MVLAARQIKLLRGQALPRTLIEIKEEQALKLIAFCETWGSHSIVDAIFALDREIRSAMESTGEIPSEAYMVAMGEYIETHYWHSAEELVAGHVFAAYEGDTSLAVALRLRGDDISITASADLDYLNAEPEIALKAHGYRLTDNAEPETFTGIVRVLGRGYLAVDDGKILDGQEIAPGALRSLYGAEHWIPSDVG